MLTIRAEQLVAFSQEADRAFIRRQTHRILAVFADSAPSQDPKELEAWIADKVDYALALGITFEPHVEDFVDLCILDQPLALRQPAADLRAVLEDRLLPAPRRIRLAQNLVFFSGRKTTKPEGGFSWTE